MAPHLLASPLLLAALAFLAGLCAGRLLALWIVALTRDETPVRQEDWIWRGRRALMVELGTALLFAGFVLAMLQFQGQATPDVRPDPFWRYGRILHHLLLIGLLVAAVGTDFRNYTVPDAITLPGIGFAVCAAVVSGELEIVPLWVDWGRLYEDWSPQWIEWGRRLPVQRPYAPAWIHNHPHWHGLAWSTAGLAFGAGMTWLVRLVASSVLGRPALGLGDVTLMALIGSFVGWQPVVFVFLLAPLCGLVVGVTVRLVTGRTFVPYGPSLGTATFVVLCGWRWIWMFEIPWTADTALPIRRLFGDAPALLILGGIALAALVLLLSLLRAYRAIPVSRRKK